jgi:hypothetical protein
MASRQKPQYGGRQCRFGGGGELLDEPESESDMGADSWGSRSPSRCSVWCAECRVRALYLVF